MLCGSLDKRVIWGRLNTCICMAESLCCPPETSQPSLLINYESESVSSSVMSNSVIPWATACQVPLPMEFSRQEYWSG